MKKIFAWVLVLMMVVGLFAGCNGTEDPTTPPAADSNLASAMEYLEAMYKDVGEKTPKDFTRPASIPFGTERYAITWTTNSEEVKVVDNGDGTVTIDVNEAVTADVNYELTATMTDANGKTATYTWKHLLPGAAAVGDQSAIVNDAYALESGASMGYEVTLTGKITAVNTAYDPDYKNVTVTIAVPGAEDKPIMCYRLKGDGAELIDNGWTITVTGTIKNYNGTIEFDAGCVLDSYVEGEGAKQPEDPAQVVDEAYALADGASLPYTATLTGKIVKIDTPYSPDYGNVTVTIAVEGSEDQPITCYRMKGTGADDLYVGDTITVKGLIKNYRGTIEFDTGCQLTAVVPGERLTAPEDPYEILDAAYALKRGENLPYEVTLTGIVTTVDEAYSEEYNNITVSITLLGAKDQPIKCYRLKGDGISKIKPSDTITVKGYITNYEGEREFVSGCQMISRQSGPGYRAPATQEEIVDHAMSLPITCTLLYKAKLTGEITKINTAYSSSYGNITVTIAVKDTAGNTQKLELYRMTGNGIKNLKVGDTVTAEGYITHYVIDWEKPIYSKIQMVKPVMTWTDAEPSEDPVVPDVAGTKVAEVVIWAPAYNKALSVTKTGNYNVGVDVTLSGTTLTGYGATEIFDLIQNEDGTYSFENNGKKLAMAAEFSSMNLDELYKTWEVTPLGNDLYNIMNVGRGNYIEWYNQYTNWSTYDSAYAATDDQFQLAFYVVSGTLPEFSGSTGGNEPEDPFVKPTTPEEIVNAAYALDEGETLAEGPYTLTGEITEVGTYNTTYKDITVTIVVNGMTDKPIECYALKGEGNDSLKVGDIITVTGTLKNYYGKVEFDKPNLISVNGEGGTTPDPTPDPDIPTTGNNVVIYAPAYNKALSATKSGNYNIGVDVTVSGTTMTGYGATEVWTLIDNGDGTYSFANGGQNIGINSGYSSMGMGVADDKWEVISLGNDLYNIKNTTRGNFMEWYASKNNWSTYDTETAATDGQFQLSFYVVSGTLPNFGGESGGEGGGEGGGETTPTYNTFAEMVEAANGLANNATLGVNITKTGVVTGTPTYNSSYNSWTFYVTIEGINLKCHSMEVAGTTTLNEGDTVEITGDLSAFDGAAQFNYNCANATFVSAGESGGEGGDEGGETPPVPTTPEEIVNAAYALAENETLEGTYTLTGVITYAEAYDTDWDNITVTIVVGDMTDKPIECYRLTGTGADTLKVTDTITVTGTLKNYYGKVEFDAGCTLDAVVPGEGVTVTDPELSFADKANRTTFTTSQQVWEQNGIIFTNNKASSTSNVADYASPVRCYKSSTITVAVSEGKIAKVVFICDSNSYATELKNTIGSEATVSGSTVTWTPATAAQSLTTGALTDQVRIKSLTVTCA